MYDKALIIIEQQQQQQQPSTCFTMSVPVRYKSDRSVEARCDLWCLQENLKGAKSAPSRKLQQKKTIIIIIIIGAA